MAKINVLCECKNSVAADVGQNIYKGKVRWYLSYTCPVCGNSCEQDGTENTPDEIREAIILEDGVWGFFISEDSKPLSSILNVLKKELDLTFEEIATIKKLIPGMVLSGTELEMQRLQIEIDGQIFKTYLKKLS